MYLDVVFLSLNGGAHDAAWAALVAALADVRLPKARWDLDLESVLCDANAVRAQRLNLRSGPISMTAGVIVTKHNTRSMSRLPDQETKQGPSRLEEEKWLLVDMDDFEESICQEEVTVVVDGRSQRILRLEKKGGQAIGVEEVKKVARLAAERWQEWKSALMG